MTQAEIFGQPGPTQAEIFGVPTRGTYGWDRQHRGRRPQMPRWYATLCDGWSRAAWHGEISWEHAAALVEVWHPLALEQALTRGSKRRPDGERGLELGLFAGLLGCGVDERTARHLVGLDETAIPTPPKRGKEETTP
jgi:hypothetical protein